MTNEQRLEKNKIIKENGKATRLRRKSQVCKVFRVKIDYSHLNCEQQIALKMLFVESKWLYNDILTFMNSNNINEYDYKIKEVNGLDKDKKPVLHDIKYLSSQMKQSVIQNVKNSLKSLSSLKSNKNKVGKLKYKSDFGSINLQQYGITYKFYDERHIKLQGIKKRIKIEGAEQFFKNNEIEYANAKLLNLPDGYYLSVTTFQNVGDETKNYKNEIGIDFGIKTSITTSEGEQIKVLIEETERLKKMQRKIMKSKLMKSERVIVLSKSEPTTKYCPTCGTQGIDAFGEVVKPR